MKCVLTLLTYDTDFNRVEKYIIMVYTVENDAWLWFMHHFVFVNSHRDVKNSYIITTFNLLEGDCRTLKGHRSSTRANMA